MSDLVLYKQHGKTVVLTLNDPAARNALGDALVDQFVAALDRVNADKDVSCIIITGAGKAFCAGGNIKEMHDRTGFFGGSPLEVRDGFAKGIQRVPVAMNALEVPAIAAVNGPAIGAGCDLAMMCDVRIAGADAVFAESFLNVGLVSGDGGAWFLPRVVGLSRALEMAFTCDLVDAEKAERWGLVNSIVSGDVVEAALDTASRITRHPPRALRLMKRLFRTGSESTLDQTLEMSAFMQSIVQSTDDHREAVAALLDKRTPAYSGN